MAIIGKLNDYYVFCAVMRNKNITHAAEELLVSQPVVTRAVQNLERDLGCSLLIRSSKGVSATYEGELLYSTLRPFFSAIESTEELIVTQKTAGELGIRVAFSDFESEYVLEMAKNRVGQAIPDSMFAMVQLNSQSIVHAIENKDIELGMVFDLDRSDQWTRDSIEAAVRNEKVRRIAVAEQEDVLVIGEDFFSEIGEETSLDVLREYPLIAPIEMNSVFSHYMSILRPDGLFPDDYPVNNLEARLSLAAAGHGFTICPVRLIRNELKNRKLFITRTEMEMLKREACLLVSGSSVLPAGTASVIDAVRHLMR